MTQLLMQILAILLTARACGWVLRRLGQPQVVGEIIAGIVLGRSALFKPGSTDKLLTLGQIGLLVFMFLVGLELKPSLFQFRKRVAFFISHMSIALPFGLGAALACLLYKEYAPPSVSALSFSLFLGISMSVTAFPVLARILREHGLTRSPVGMLAISCAAIDDATAWLLLAVVIGVVKASSLEGVAYTLLLAAAYLAICFCILQPLLSRWCRNRADPGTVSTGVLSVSLVFMLASALTTELIGIQAFFGAFVAGTLAPLDDKFRDNITRQIQGLGTTLLLPLYFALSGLRTQIALVSDLRSIGVGLLIITVAVLGKLGTATLTARLCGIRWKESATLGILMNTRGLMELVVLNIGFDLGVLSPKIFTLLVIMAVVTTMMTGPLLSALGMPVLAQSDT